ncbi:MAG: bifunctional diaminohydroxyphosphoribosylaminopyrimidine deaminase/5-amino-6-(5-phosphoribosylamino)uracil reductase RibD, partial [Bacteroidetes bacterium SW_10_40_5]
MPALENLYMQRCLELARNGLGHVAPNPLVGCVIEYDGMIIGEGYHAQYGASHAEVNAIQSVEKQEWLQASTLYVNLEPCSHHGKTPPCTDVIIQHQIPSVVIGVQDDHEKVAGKGIDQLKQAGIRVKTKVLEQEAYQLNKRFFTFHNKQRPYILL